jgi:hypothetical protein
VAIALNTRQSALRVLRMLTVFVLCGVARRVAFVEWCERSRVAGSRWWRVAVGLASLPLAMVHDDLFRMMNVVRLGLCDVQGYLASRGPPSVHQCSSL